MRVNADKTKAEWTDGAVTLRIQRGRNGRRYRAELTGERRAFFESTAGNGTP
jgi:hypothetical protein